MSRAESTASLATPAFRMYFVTAEIVLDCSDGKKKVQSDVYPVIAVKCGERFRGEWCGDVSRLVIHNDECMELELVSDLIAEMKAWSIDCLFTMVVCQWPLEQDADRLAVVTSDLEARLAEKLKQGEKS